MNEKDKFTAEFKSEVCVENVLHNQHIILDALCFLFEKVIAVERKIDPKSGDFSSSRISSKISPKPGSQGDAPPPPPAEVSTVDPKNEIKNGRHASSRNIKPL